MDLGRGGGGGGRGAKGEIAPSQCMPLCILVDFLYRIWKLVIFHFQVLVFLIITQLQHCCMCPQLLHTCRALYRLDYVPYKGTFHSTCQHRNTSYVPPQPLVLLEFLRLLGHSNSPPVVPSGSSKIGLAVLQP